MKKKKKTRNFVGDVSLHFVFNSSIDLNNLIENSVDELVDLNNFTENSLSFLSTPRKTRLRI